MIKFTDAAAAKMKEATSGTELKDAAFRIAIQGAGCAGFQYVFDITTKFNEEDTIFEDNGAKAVVDPISFPYVMGATIDFEKDPMGESFIIVNPQVKNSCGCGNSFSM